MSTIRPKNLCGTLVTTFLVTTLWLMAAHPETVRESATRRSAYLQSARDGATVIFNAEEEDLLEYRTDKNFYYLTQCSEPGAILVLSPGHTFKETLFLPSPDPERDKWTGPRLRPDEATARQLAVERVLSLDRFHSELQNLTQSKRRLYTVLPKRSAGHSSGSNGVDRLKQLFPFAEVLDAGSRIAKLRMKKSSAETLLLRRAIEITLYAQRAAAKTIRPDRFEYEVEAALEYEFARNGARPAFPSIVGSGSNATILHYAQNRRQMKSGDLVVVDIGAEFEEYAADVTRTYPVSGEFSPRQREIYQVVLAAQEAALAAVRPGVSWGKSGAIYKAAFDAVNAHGADSQGKPLGQYFNHGVSHHLGLDVHDVVDDATRLLEAGMVITVEPGVYIPEENIGVRIEDVVMVTDNGYELLTHDLPRRPEEIEKLMKKATK